MSNIARFKFIYYLTDEDMARKMVVLLPAILLAFYLYQACYLSLQRLRIEIWSSPVGTIKIGKMTAIKVGKHLNRDKDG